MICGLGVRTNNDEQLLTMDNLHVICCSQNEAALVNVKCVRRIGSHYEKIAENLLG